ILGGLAGKGVAEKINPTLEAKHWQDHHAAQPYAHLGSYDDFDPAYRVSYESYPELESQYNTFEQAEPELRKRYHAKNPKMRWEDVSPASRAAWNRIIAQREADKKA
ncbi:MAG: glycine zipper family protein, partial [Verrucomicrobia bacterium]|nr:glycine zipper family protein [Verrucomicrobiota bacterium]